jgi:hypothetical protein
LIFDPINKERFRLLGPQILSVILGEHAREIARQVQHIFDVQSEQMAVV